MEDNCDNDYLIIKEGFNPKKISNKVDRFCGEALNPLPSKNVSVTVCCKSQIKFLMSICIIIINFGHI